MATVLVTGGSGYLATHIVQQLLAAGYRVRASVRDLHSEAKTASLRGLCPDSEHPLDLVEADLLTPESWPAAVSHCAFVIHTASPAPHKNPKHEDDIIKPAVEGTLNVLRACRDNRSVTRVVLTGSAAAICSGFDDIEGKVYTEADWANVDDVSAYPKSKILAEKAAWEFVGNLSEAEKFELCVINPVFIVGPVVCSGFATSMLLPKRLMKRTMPLVPALNLPLVDVRDVAASHIAALAAEGAAGNRHIVHGDNMWVREIATVLAAEFDSQGYNVPTRLAPYWMLWLYSGFDGTVRLLLRAIGKVSLVDNTRMRNVLGVKPRDVRVALVDMCYSMIDNGMLPKTRKYRGPTNRHAS